MFLDKIRSLVSGDTPKTVPATPATPDVPGVWTTDTTAKTDSTTPLPPPPTFRPLTTLDAALAPAPSTLDLAVSQPSSRADLIEIRVNGLDEAKKNAVWLTKGQDRTQPATAVKLVDCTTDHLKNIVTNKPNLSADYRRVIEAILEDRGETLDDSDDAYTL
jgi:hypothetical protein